MFPIKSNYILIVSISLILYSCNNKIENTESLLSYINDTDNGLVKKKSVNNLNVEIKYLPKQYIEKKELQINSDKNSFENEYLVFLISIKPDSEQNNSVIYNGINKYGDYKERVFDLNFNIEEQVSLKVGEHSYKPVLSFFENIYNLKPGIDILLFFSPVNESQKDMFTTEILDIVYEDKEFGTGINHFLFNSKDINELHKKI